ncbi:hypothetical protein B0A52_04648 [Exophiala mesophila]|uniref:Aflatoxin regulatory protein domain-containing protein n=1 Tax=Exophiala mesophila TaxID=212818 RepID=A0A438N8E4_EXOME|nr:hypothetical protein B0A52_04648 [Exophiala mesophila]
MVGRTRGRHGRSGRNNDASRSQPGNAPSQASTTVSTATTTSATTLVQDDTNSNSNQDSSIAALARENFIWSPIPPLPDSRPSVCSDFDFSSIDSFSEHAHVGDIRCHSRHYQSDIFADMLDDPSLNFFEDSADHRLATSYHPNTPVQVFHTTPLPLPPVTSPPPLHQPLVEKSPDVMDLEVGPSSTIVVKSSKTSTALPTSQPGMATASSTSSGNPTMTTTPSNSGSGSWKDPFATTTAASDGNYNNNNNFQLGFSVPLPCNQLSARAQSIMACASILSYVEERCDGIDALDEALRINKELMNKITQVVKAACFRESPGSMVVLVQCLRPVVTMLETSCLDLCPSLLQHKKGHQLHHSRRFGGADKKSGEDGGRLAHPDPPSSRTRSLPDIGFGCFSIDPEEQKAIQATIISRELCRTLDVIKSLTSSLAPLLSLRRADMDFARQSLSDLEQRVSHVDLCISVRK